MSTGYAGNPASFPANVRLVDDGEPASAAFLGLCSQDLADRTAWLKAQLAGVVAAPTVVGAADNSHLSFTVTTEAIVRCTATADQSVFLPNTANAPVGRSVLIVGFDGAHTITIAPQGSDAIFSTHNTIRAGNAKEIVLAKKIDATTWALLYISDYDLETSVKVLQQIVINAWRSVTTAITVSLTSSGDDRHIIVDNATAVIQLPDPATINVGHTVWIVSTSNASTNYVLDHSGGSIVNHTVTVSVFGAEVSFAMTWNGTNWIRK